MNLINNLPYVAQIYTSNYTSLHSAQAVQAQFVKKLGQDYDAETLEMYFRSVYGGEIKVEDLRILVNAYKLAKMLQDDVFVNQVKQPICEAANPENFELLWNSGVSEFQVACFELIKSEKDLGAEFKGAKTFFNSLYQNDDIQKLSDFLGDSYDLVSDKTYHLKEILKWCLVQKRSVEQIDYFLSKIEKTLNKLFSTAGCMNCFKICQLRSIFFSELCLKLKGNVRAFQKIYLLIHPSFLGLNDVLEDWSKSDGNKSEENKTENILQKADIKKVQTLSKFTQVNLNPLLDSLKSDKSIRIASKNPEIPIHSTKTTFTPKTTNGPISLISDNSDNVGDMPPTPPGIEHVKKKKNKTKKRDKNSNSMSRTDQSASPNINSPNVNSSAASSPIPGGFIQFDTKLGKTGRTGDGGTDSDSKKSRKSKKDKKRSVGDGRKASETKSHKIPGGTVPEAKIPEVKIPEVKIPEVKNPELKIPELKIREVKILEVKTTEIKIPEMKISEAITTEVKLSQTSSPDIKTLDQMDNKSSNKTNPKDIDQQSLFKKLAQNQQAKFQEANTRDPRLKGTVNEVAKSDVLKSNTWTLLEDKSVTVEHVVGKTIEKTILTSSEPPQNSSENSNRTMSPNPPPSISETSKKLAESLSKDSIDNARKPDAKSNSKSALEPASKSTKPITKPISILNLPPTPSPRAASKSSMPESYLNSSSSCDDNPRPRKISGNKVLTKKKQYTSPKSLTANPSNSINPKIPTKTPSKTQTKTPMKTPTQTPKTPVVTPSKPPPTITPKPATVKSKTPANLVINMKTPTKSPSAKSPVSAASGPPVRKAVRGKPVVKESDKTPVKVKRRGSTGKAKGKAKKNDKFTCYSCFEEYVIGEDGPFPHRFKYSKGDGIICSCFQCHNFRMFIYLRFTHLPGFR